jgi:Mg-chelatase subunit ChlD
MPYLIAVFLLFSLTCHSQCNKMDIVIIGDYSGSVQGNEEFVTDAISTFASSVHSETVRVAVVLFDNQPKIIAELNSEVADLLAQVFSYRDVFATGGTNIESALQMAANILLTEQNDSRKLVILISDGDVTTGTPEGALMTGKQLNAIGVGICSVLIQNKTSQPDFMKEISGGCYVESNYESLSKELKNLNICL